VGRYYTPVLGGSYLFEYRLKRSTLWGAQVKGCDLVVNTWQVSELDLEVHLITCTGIKFKPLSYLASFQSVNSCPKWEPLIFGFRIELRTGLKTKWVSNTRPTLVYTATELTHHGYCISRELEPNRKNVSYPPTIHPSIHPSIHPLWCLLWPISKLVYCHFSIQKL
jgi:hypothetical protein